MTNRVARPNQYTVKQLLSADAVKAKFDDVLGKKAPQFTTSLINVVNSSYQLKNADANSVIASALVAASLDLPVNPSLGYMYIIPYKSNGRQIAQPQIGYKGYIQLAQRSGQYKHLNAIPVYEGELQGWNPLTEEVVYEPKQDRDTDDQPIGYLGYMELLNGFSKTVYWTHKQIDDHRREFSKSGGKDKPKGVWADHYDAMALKTVLRNLLTKWGPMTVDMQSADMADSGEYDHLEEERREVRAEENEPDANDIIAGALAAKEQDSEPDQPVEKGDDNANQKEQEELFVKGTITPDVK